MSHFVLAIWWAAIGILFVGAAPVKAQLAEPAQSTLGQRIEAAAKAALENLRRDFGKKSPGMVAAWDRAWDQFIPFLEFDSAIRKVIYTTNAIESVNFQLRKITKNRGHFPTDDAAVKLLYLGIRNITGRHTRQLNAVRQGLLHVSQGRGRG